MKKLLCLIILIICMACATDQSKNQTNTSSTNQTESHNFDWLLGSWIRQNNEEGKKTFESWAKKSTEEYNGLGYTLQNQDTVFKEVMRLIKIEGVWNLEVSGVNENPTFFVFSRQSTNRFICENEANEFPKKIEYWLEGNQLHAKISDGKMEVPFIFEKMPLE